MTSGDGLLQALPTYFGRTPLWEPNLMLGYPLFADPNQAYWYLPLRIARLIPGAFNSYAYLPYVLASFGVAGFARRLTGSTGGGIIAGLTFGLGGFMISHQGHLNIVHPAAWTPFVLWSIEELRRGVRFRAIFVGCGAVAFALSALGGTQQPLAYVSLVGIAYAIVFAPLQRRDRRHFWLLTAGIFVLGVALSAITTVPAAELTGESTRATQSYADYIAFSSGTIELPIRAFFPFFFGATASAVYPFSHENVGAFSETTNYEGILPLMLCALAFVRAGEKRQKMFWFCVALWGAWMSIGDGLLAARIARHIPIYGLFRIPGRHALEFALAIAVLSAFGVSELECGRVRTRDAAIAIASIVAAFGAALASIAVFGNAFRIDVAERADPTSVAALPAVPLLFWENPALAIPCCTVVGACIALVVWMRAPRAIGLGIGILAVACDLFTFAGFSYWRYANVNPGDLRPPAIARDVLGTMQERQQRLLASSGSRIAQAVPPNLSTLWAIPTVGGYVSLEDRRVAMLLDMAPTGEIAAPTFARDDDFGLDLVATRFVLAPAPPPVSVPETQEFASNELGGFIGADALTPRKTLTLGFAKNHADVVDLVSALGVSMTIPNDAVVAQLDVRDDAGASFLLPVLAGRDSSESAYDRPDVRAIVQHAKAHVYSDAGGALLYVARFRIPTHRSIRSVKVRWTYPDPAVGAMSVTHVALVDTTSHLAYPPTAYPPDWRTRGTFGTDVLFENPRALPGAWVVSSAVALRDNAQVAAIQEGIIPGSGRSFDPRESALVSDPHLSFPDNTRTPQREVEIAEHSATNDRYLVRCSVRCMLVIDGLWYPGWRATVDGIPASVLRVDALLRGVDLAAGRHDVTLRFIPLSLTIGAAISILALVITCLGIFIDLSQARRAGIQSTTKSVSGT